MPIGVQPGPRLLPAEQAGRRGHHGAATRTAGRRWSSWCPAEPRVFPVGRLDVDTEGLLLLTNDGELAHRLTHPSHGVEKEYLAEVDGGAGRAGRAAPAARGRRARRRRHRAGQGRRSPSPGVLRITIHEGRNRQVRRMCEASAIRCSGWCGCASAPLRDRTLAPGEWRELHARRGPRS